jgi:hypothetical protein
MRNRPEGILPIQKMWLSKVESASRPESTAIPNFFMGHVEDNAVATRGQYMDYACVLCS